MGASLDRFFALAEQKQFLDAPIQANRYRGQIFGVPFRRRRPALLPEGSAGEISHTATAHLAELVEEAKTILAHEKDPQLVGFPVNSSSTRD